MLFSTMAKGTGVYLEIGKRLTFACAIEWPGWSRSGRDETSALAALANYAERYHPVAELAGLKFSATPGSFAIEERLRGSATTDFGAPEKICAADRVPSTPASRRRSVAIVRAAWTVLDNVVANASAELRKGPRGGGRDRDAIAQHVLAAEAMYARRIGLKLVEPTWGDGKPIAAFRDSIAGALQGKPDPSARWPALYAARRIAWHVLDHAWEIEDKSLK